MDPREKFARDCDSLADYQWELLLELRKRTKGRKMDPIEAMNRERWVESARWHRLHARMLREADREEQMERAA